MAVSKLQHCRRSLVADEQLYSKWPSVVLAGLVLLAFALVASVIAANPRIFKREFKAQFLLVSFVQLDIQVDVRCLRCLPSCATAIVAPALPDHHRCILSNFKAHDDACFFVVAECLPLAAPLSKALQALSCASWHIKWLTVVELHHLDVAPVQAVAIPM